MSKCFPLKACTAALALATLLVALASAAEPASKASQIQLDYDGRSIDVWQWGLNNKKGVVLFSHGALSAPWKYQPLVDAWVEEGYRVYAPLHVDSSDHPHTKDYPGMASWSKRLEDMERLADTFGAEGYVAAGHSYGALLALAKGGVSTAKENYTKPITDRRVSLVLAFSPPGALPPLVEEEGFTGLAVPALIQTGTEDNPFGDKKIGWQSHLTAFNRAAELGERYALVIEGVDHYFGGAICRPELPGPKQGKK